MRCLFHARNQTIATAGGRIVPPTGQFDYIVDLPDAQVRPGLINAHDHLHRNHYGRLGNPPYRNAYEWARHIRFRYRRAIGEGRRRSRRSALLEGAWKNLFAGVTTVVHHDPWEPDFDRDFPIRVAALPNVDSIGMGNAEAIDTGDSYALHVAEGVDEVSAGEINSLEVRGLLTSRLLAVHCVGLADRDVVKFRDSGASLVWCPSSNVFLFGRTAPAQLLRSGIDVLIGSDSRLTGMGDLLDELRFARSLAILEDSRLEDAVGATAARRLGLDEPSLEIGAAADLIFMSKPLLDADASDVALVVVGGIPRVARPAVVASLGRLAERGRALTIGKITRWANMDIVKIEESLG